MTSKFEQYLLNPEQPHDRAAIDPIINFLDSHVAANYPHLRDDPVFVQQTKDIAYGRYNGCISAFVPWLYRHLEEHRPRDVIEIGCGTGSTTAAFARICERVTAYDLDANALQIANLRINCLGIDNARVELIVDAATSHRTMKERHPDGVDGVILYAVLEHMTVNERIETLRFVWSIIRPGGFLFVGETPNRLAYCDYHTTELPFFNLLNEELALLYYGRTSRNDVKHSVEAALKNGHEAGKLALVRAGYSGASYHEFELALGGNYACYIISRPDDEEIRGLYAAYEPDVAPLKQYCALKGLDVHPCFQEAFLLFIMRKPA